MGTAIKGSDFPLPNYNKVLPSWLSQICPSLQKRTQSQVSHLYLSENKASCCFTSANSTKNPKAFIERSIHKKCYSKEITHPDPGGIDCQVWVLFPKLHHLINKSHINICGDSLQRLQKIFFLKILFRRHMLLVMMYQTNTPTKDN